jgi:hypothetical protein
MGRIAIKEAAALSAPGLGSAQALELARHAQVSDFGSACGGCAECGHWRGFGPRSCSLAGCARYPVLDSRAQGGCGDVSASGARVLFLSLSIHVWQLQPG